jgi:hypothetical protein
MADDYSFLEARRRGAPVNRGADMAAMFLGGGNQLNQARLQNQGMYEGARGADAMAQARLRQQQEVSRAAVVQHLRDSGQGDIADMAAAGLNPNEFAEAALNKQKADHIAQAWEQATGQKPDLNMINRMLMVQQGKPETLSKVEGNVALNPMVTPDQNKFAPTAVGQADIAQKAAQALDERAAAGQHGAEADLAHARSDELKDPKKRQAKVLTRDEILGLAGTPDKFGVMQVDPEKWADYQSFKKRNAATDSAYLDDQYASMMYTGGQQSRQAGLANMAAEGMADAPQETAPSNPSGWTGGGAVTNPPPMHPDAAPTPGGNGIDTMFDEGSPPRSGSTTRKVTAATDAGTPDGLDKAMFSQHDTPAKSPTNPQHPTNIAAKKGGGGPAGKYVEGKVYVDANGNRAMYKNGQWVEQ